MRKLLILVVALAFFFVAVALGAQNKVVVAFNYLAGIVELRLATLLGIALLCGFIGGVLAAMPLLIKWRLQTLSLRRRLKRATGNHETSA